MKRIRMARLGSVAAALTAAGTTFAAASASGQVPSTAATFTDRAGAQGAFVADVLAAPTGLVTSRSETSNVLAWQPSPSSYTTGYAIQRGPSADGPWTTIATVQGRSTLAYSDTEPEAGETYYYRVQAIAYNWVSGATTPGQATVPVPSQPDQAPEDLPPPEEQIKTIVVGEGTRGLYQIASDGDNFYAASRDYKPAPGIYKATVDLKRWTLLAQIPKVTSVLYYEGWLYAANQSTGQLYRVNPDTGAYQQIGDFGSATGHLATDGHFLYLAQPHLNAIRKIELNSSATVAYDRGLIWTGLSDSYAIMVDAIGNMYAGNGYDVMHRAPNGTVRRLARLNGRPWGMISSGTSLYVAEETGNASAKGRIVKINLTTGAAETAVADLDTPIGLNTDGRTLYYTLWSGNGGLWRIERP
ncbi:SMP-30/gluconolactonase/LRE family protein [Nocardioides pakistanensis]